MVGSKVNHYIYVDKKTDKWPSEWTMQQKTYHLGPTNTTIQKR